MDKKLSKALERLAGRRRKLYRRLAERALKKKYIRKVVVWYGSRPVGHDPTDRNKAKMYCAVNVNVATINPDYSIDTLYSIAERIALQLESDPNLNITMNLAGIEDEQILDEDEYMYIKSFLDKYNERATKCFREKLLLGKDETFEVYKHILIEILICGIGLAEEYVEPFVPKETIEELCGECLLDYHSLYVLFDKDPFERCKLFKIGGWREETKLPPIR